MAGGLAAPLAISADIETGPGHKWMNGPPGTGVLYIRNADIRPPEFYPTVSQRMSKYSSGGTDRKYPFMTRKLLTGLFMS